MVLKQAQAYVLIKVENDQTEIQMDPDYSSLLTVVPGNLFWDGTGFLGCINSLAPGRFQFNFR